MSNQRYYGGGSAPAQDDPSNNPWQEEQPARQPQNYSSPPVPNQNNPWEAQQQPQQSAQNQQSYQQPSPFQQGQQAQARQQQPRLPQERTADFVPESERGEQFETMQEFEMRKSKPDSQEDMDVATLQKEFPDMDGSLIAAIYGDSKSLGATREMLQALE